MSNYLLEEERKERGREGGKEEDSEGGRKDILSPESSTHSKESIERTMEFRGRSSVFISSSSNSTPNKHWRQP